MASVAKRSKLSSTVSAGSGTVQNASIIDEVDPSEFRSERRVRSTRNVAPVYVAKKAAGGSKNAKKVTKPKETKDGEPWLDTFGDLTNIVRGQFTPENGTVIYLTGSPRKRSLSTSYVDAHPEPSEPILAQPSTPANNPPGLWSIESDEPLDEEMIVDDSSPTCLFKIVNCRSLEMMPCNPTETPYTIKIEPLTDEENEEGFEEMEVDPEPQTEDVGQRSPSPQLQQLEQEASNMQQGKEGETAKPSFPQAFRGMLLTLQELIGAATTVSHIASGMVPESHREQWNASMKMNIVRDHLMRAEYLVEQHQLLYKGK